MWIVIVFLSLVIAACSTPSYVPTSKSTSLRELVESDWKIAWPANEPTTGITSTAMLRVANYSTPPFIHRQFLELLSQPQKDLAALCTRQSGRFIYQGMPKPPASRKPLTDATYQAKADWIIRSAKPGSNGMREVIAQMEQANTGLVLRKWIEESRGAPDQLTRDAVMFAADQKWLGIFSCSSGSENWMASIFFDGWSNQTKGGSLYKAVKITSRLTIK